MNSFPFIKDFYSKLNNIKTNKFKFEFNNLLKEKFFFKKILKKKYIISSLIVIFGGGFSLLYFGNKQGKISEINKPIQVNLENNVDEITKPLKVNEENNIDETTLLSKINQELDKESTKKIEIEKVETIKEDFSVDFLSPLTKSSELISEIPKGRLDPFNKFNNLEFNSDNEGYLDLTIYGIIASKETTYALIKSDFGNVLICPEGRGKCDKFSSNVLPANWKLVKIDINTGCVNFINSKSIEKIICMNNI